MGINYLYGSIEIIFFQNDSKLNYFWGFIEIIFFYETIFFLCDAKSNLFFFYENKLFLGFHCKYIFLCDSENIFFAPTVSL